MDDSKPKKPVMSDMVPVRKPVSKPKVLTVKEEPVVAVVKAEKKPVYDHVYEEPTGNIPKTRRSGCVLPFIVIVCAVSVTLAVGGLLSGARITIVPKTFSGSVDTIVALSQVKTSGSVMVSTATRVFTQEQVVPKTGTVARESLATGTVRVYNPGTKAVTLPSKTVIVSSRQQQYALAKTVTVPAAKKGVPGQVDVVASAVASGSQFNADADDFSFLNNAKSGLTVHSVTAMTGGASGSDSLADPTSVAQATDAVRAAFPDTSVLISRMSEEVPDTSIVLPISFPSSVPTVTVEPNHDDGVHVVATESLTILLVNRSDLARVFGGLVSAPSGTLLSLPSFDGLTVTTDALGSSNSIPATMQIRVTGTATVRGLVDSAKILSELPGVSRGDAKEILSKISEIQSFAIRMRPFWRRTFPSKIKDISVSVQ